MSYSPRSVFIVEGPDPGSTSLPHPALTTHVASFWALTLEGRRRQVRCLPDGCVDLTFDLDRGNAAGYVTGPQARPRTFVLEGRVDLFGVRLFPAAAIPLLGGRVDPQVVWSPLSNWISLRATPLATALARAPHSAARMELMEEWLTQRLLGGAEDPTLGRAVELIFQRGGAVRVPELAAALKLGQRTLEQLFTARVGLPPDRFGRVVRFQHVLRRIHGKPDWGLLAAALGHPDQDRLSAEFEDLFGCTPGQAAAILDDPGPDAVSLQA